MKDIKDRAPKKLIPRFNGNEKKKEKEQVVVFYRPCTLGEWERYAADSKSQVQQIFKNHVNFENLTDPETRQSIVTGNDLMESTYAPYRKLLIEIYAWVLGFFAIPSADKKN